MWESYHCKQKKKIKSFPEKKNQKKAITTKPGLQETLKDLFEEEEKEQSNIVKKINWWRWKMAAR